MECAAGARPGGAGDEDVRAHGGGTMPRGLGAILRGLLGAAALVVALDGLAWWLLSGQIEGATARFVAESAKSGWAIQTGASHRAGWPLAARLVLDDVTAAGAAREIPGGIAWRARRLQIGLDVRHLTKLVVRADGEQALRLGGLPELAYTSETLTLEVALALGQPPQAASLHAAGLRGTGAAAQGLAIGTLDAHVTWPPTVPDAAAAAGGIAARIEARAVTLPASGHWPFGGRIDRLEADAEAERAGTSAALPGSAVLLLRHLALTAGALDLTGHFTLGFDAARQPGGAGEIRVVDPARTVEELVRNGTIDRRAGFAVDAMLLLLARTPPGGGKPVLEAPFSLRDRVVSVGQVPLFRLPAPGQH